MSTKSTRVIDLLARDVRVGGVNSGHGAQPLGFLPSNWYPVNPPSASAATPQTSDCQTLLNGLAANVARLTVEYSTVLASVYRAVQGGVADGANFSLTYQGTPISAASTTLFDQGIKIGELVAVDVVNKNPALLYDLAVRLAVSTAYQLDTLLLAKYASFTLTAQGTAGTTPSAANLTAALGLLPVTGEPVLGFLKSTVYQAMLAAGSLPSMQGAYQDVFRPGYAPNATPAANNRGARIYPSDAVAATTGPNTIHNVLLLPSALALVTGDLGTSLGAAPSAGITSLLTGPSNMIATSTYINSESSRPELTLQLVLSNTGTGTQAVWVNAQYAPLVLAPGSGVQVLA